MNLGEYLGTKLRTAELRNLCKLGGLPRGHSRNEAIGILITQVEAWLPKLVENAPIVADAKTRAKHPGL